MYRLTGGCAEGPVRAKRGYGLARVAGFCCVVLRGAAWRGMVLRMERITFSCDDKTAERLRTLAGDTRRSVSQMVAFAVESYLADLEVAARA